MDIILQNICDRLTTEPSANIKIILCEVHKVIGGKFSVYYSKRVGVQYITGKCDNGIDSVQTSSTNLEGHFFYERVIKGDGSTTELQDVVNTDFNNSDSFVSEFDIVSYMGVPITSGGKILGALSVGFDNSHKFSDKEIKILKDFASLLTIVELHLNTCMNLAVSNEKYNSVYNNSTDCIILLNNETIVDINNTGCQLFGYNKEELAGINWREMLIEKKTEAYDVLKFLKKASIGDQEHIENQFIKKDGSSFDGEINFRKLEGTEEYNLLAIIRDITSRITYEKQLIEAKEKATEKSNMKSLSLASMSHELRTPLNSIIGFSDLLLDDETTEDEKEMFSKLIRSAGRSLMQLISDIIDISKIEAGHVTVKKETINVNNFLQEILLTFRQEKESQGKSDIELKMVLSDKASGLKIKTDPHRLKQVFNNLLTNSLKFIDQGFIEFGYLSVTPDFVQFYVKDTGIGIDTAKREKIFEQFGRDLNTYNRNPDGTGLGLAISKSFVELLGGNIWLDSEIDAGTTFYFTIPLVNKNPKIVISDSRSWRSKTILIADDVEENFIFLKGVLLDTGVKIIWAKNGKEAVDICDSEKIDMVLMDIRMPVMNGLEASKIISKKSPGTIIIAQTAFANPEDKVNCSKYGCHEYLKKPIDYEKLFKVITKYFG